MKAWWPLLLLAVPLMSGAQTDVVDSPDNGKGGGAIYRTQDADGNVVFTDNPPDKKRAEEVKVGPTNTMDSPPSRPRVEVSEEQPAPVKVPDNGYQSLEITAPQAQANVRIPQQNPVQVQVALSPSLKSGHRLVILDNGSPLEGSAMDFPDPGAHTLVAQVRDGDGSVLIESLPLVFYIMRTTAATGGGDGEDAGSAFPTYGGRAQRGDAATTGDRAGRGGGANRGGVAALGGGAQRVTRPSGD